MRACTASVVRVEWDDSPLYQADVEFISLASCQLYCWERGMAACHSLPPSHGTVHYHTHESFLPHLPFFRCLQEEWDRQLESAWSDLLEEDGQLRIMRDLPDTRTPAGAAQAQLEAVFGRDLVRRAGVSLEALKAVRNSATRHLGTTLHIREHRAKDFRKVGIAFFCQCPSRALLQPTLCQPCRSWASMWTPTTGGTQPSRHGRSCGCALQGLRPPLSLPAAGLSTLRTRSCHDAVIPGLACRSAASAITGHYWPPAACWWTCRAWPTPTRPAAAWPSGKTRHASQDANYLALPHLFSVHKPLPSLIKMVLPHMISAKNLLPSLPHWPLQLPQRVPGHLGHG